MNEQQPDRDDLVERILRSPSYRRADKDLEFLERDEVRPVRLSLELLKPELIQREEGIRSTIVVFGSSRLVEPAEAERRLGAAQAALAQKPGDPSRQRAVAIARRQLALAPYYDQAREFGQLANWSMLVEEGLISPHDLRLFHYAETAQEAWDIIAAQHPPSPPA